MKKCPFCGKSHQDEKTVICTVCGTNMDEPSKSEKPSVKKGSLSKEKKLWAIIIMLIVTLFLAVAVTVVVMNIINDNETAEEVTVDEDQEQEDEEEEAPSDEPEEEPEEIPREEKPIDEPEEDQNKEDSSVDSDCTIVNCHTSITLRKTPNITAEEVTQVPFGADVEYVRYARNGFCEINYGDYTGYVPVTFIDEPREVPVRWTAEVVDCDEYITLRTLPSTTGEALDTVPLGAEVDFITLGENHFSLVKYDGLYGFVLDSYLDY